MRDPYTALRKTGVLLVASVTAGVLVAALAFPAVGGVGLATRSGAHAFQALPHKLDAGPLPRRSRILAANGDPIATFYTENRVTVPRKKVAPVMREAIVAIEDSRFYQHGAVDFKGVARALAANLRTGEVRQGGSTLEQQYVKRVRLENADTEAEREAATATTLSRKLQELSYALAVEKEYSKAEILNRYLNIAYFGDGAYGIEVAARHYFGKHASKLTLPQAALLAGVVRSPSAYDPARHPKAAKHRRDVVLDRMAALDMISHQKAEKAKERSLGLHVRPMRNGCTDSNVPFFCVYVANEIQHNPAFGKTEHARMRLLREGGITVHTTLRWRTQNAARKAVRHFAPPRHSDHKAAAEAMVKPGTGQIMALAVSKKYGSGKGHTQINLAADYAHGGNTGAQSGSTFKAFTLATALSEHMPYGTWIHAQNHIVLTGFEDCHGNPITTPWSVGNAGESEAGTYNLLTGIAQSVNTFFAPLEKRVGLCDAVTMARELGMRRSNGTPIRENASFTLGTDTVDPLHVASAFATFAARGKYCEPFAITKATDPGGRVIYHHKPGCEQVMDPSIADGVNFALAGVLTHGTAQCCGIGRAAAGKTGTTNNYTAAWFSGYTPDLAASVWVGDPRGGDDHPLQNVCIGGSCFAQVFGASLPAPIWAQSMRDALEGVAASSFVHPPGWMFANLHPKKEEKPEPEETPTPPPRPPHPPIPPLPPRPPPPGHGGGQGDEAGHGQ